jgi:hypothetical protein
VRFDSADKALRAAILLRFAESDRETGAPVRCRFCLDHKVIFESRRAVEGAIAQMIALNGDPNLHPYRCPNSSNWHYTSMSEEDVDAARDENPDLRLDDR